MPKVYVIGYAEQLGHEVGVRAAFLADARHGCTAGQIAVGDREEFLAEYPFEDVSMVEAWRPTVQAAVEYAVAQGAVGLIFSYSHAFALYTAWEIARQGGVWVWHAHFSNAEVYTEHTKRLYFPLTVGGESATEPGPKGSWGPGLELDTFFPPGLLPSFPGGSFDQSITTPWLANVMLRLWAGVGAGGAARGNLWDARALVRQAAGDYASGHDPGGSGYGLVDPLGPLPRAVELQPPVDIRADADDGSGVVTLRWVNFETSSWHRTVILRGDGVPVYAGTGEAATVPNLGPFSFYSEDVYGGRSRDDNTNTLALSGYAPYVPPSPALTAGRTAAGVSLSWAPGDGFADGYELERAGGGPALAAETVAEAYADGAAARGRPYRYRVRALTAGVAGAWSAPALVPALAPAAPAPFAGVLGRTLAFVPPAAGTPGPAVLTALAFDPA